MRSSIISAISVIALLSGAACGAADSPVAPRRLNPSATPSATPSANPTVTLVLGGDVLLGRGVAKRAQRVGWGRLLGDATRLLRRGDLAIVNLESPLGPCLPGGTARAPRLCGDPRGLTALKAAGVDAASLANNHALDAGPEGLRRTAGLLRRVGIRPLGVQAVLTGRPQAEALGPLTVVAVNLMRPVLSPGRAVALPSPAAVAREIRRTRRAAPRRPVILLAHLGREYDRYPGPRERAYGRAAVAAGATAVVFHGAHVRRARATDRGAVVHLGLGNLLFDQRDPRTRTGALLTLRLTPGRRAQVVAEHCVDNHTGAVMACPPLP